MKEYSIYVSLFIGCILMISCKEDEHEINLGNNFYYIPFQEITFDVTGFGGNGIFKYEDSLEVPVIFPEIIDYKYDSLYVIVKQKFNSKETSYLLESMLFMPDTYFKYDKKFVPLNEKYVIDIDSTMNSTILYQGYIKKIMNEDENIKKMKENLDNYYIISKEEKIILGPFTEYEFIKEKQKRRIYLEFEK